MVTGLEAVIKNLNKEVKKIEGRTREGLRAAALFVENESNETVPQEFGVLLNSSFSQSDKTSAMPRATVGYTAKYAPFVHEMPASFNYTKPGTGPKFLQKAVSNNHNQILGIIAKRAKIK